MNDIVQNNYIKRSALGLILCCVVMFSSNAYAWFDSGHMIIAKIAQDNLTKDTLNQVNTLLQELKDLPPSYTDFLQCATWMDGIKSTGLEYFNDLHFSDQYYMVGGISEKPQFENKNVVWAIQQSYDTLIQAKNSTFSRALALRFLIHTVGDVHQPLHAASLVSKDFPNGNAGGNLFMIQPTGSGKYTKLHALWDSGVLLFPDVKATSPNYSQTVADAAAKILKSVNTAELKNKSALKTNPPDFWVWADESFAGAKFVAYNNISPNNAPSDMYIKGSQQAVAERVVLAGYRLANLLNYIFTNLQ